MARYFVLAAMCLGTMNAGNCLARPSAQAAEHTVSWYLNNASERNRVTGECENDRTFENYPDCRNASVAEKQASISKVFVPGNSSTKPSFYADKRQRAIQLALCKIAHGPPSADCVAAMAEEIAAGTNKAR